jgi:centromere protein C
MRSAQVGRHANKSRSVGTIPEPVAVMTDRRRSNMRVPIPKSKSPIKTFLQSPARRHPSLGPKSSPMRGSIVSPARPNIPHPVNRRLDFSIENLDRYGSKGSGKSPGKKQTLSRPASTVKPYSTGQDHLSPLAKPTGSSRQRQHDEVQNTYAQVDEDYDLDNLENSYQVPVDDYRDIEDQYYEQHDDQDGHTPEPEPEAPPPQQATKKRRRTPEEDDPLPEPSKGKGRKRVAPVANMQDPQRPAKKRRTAVNNEPARAEVAKKAAPKPHVKRNLSPPVASSPVEVQRGPPRPKNNRGLYILRRETPDDGFSTRSGRHVIKPVAYWKNEEVVYGDDDEAGEDASFIRPTIKAVIRKDQVEETKRRRTKKAGSRKPGRKAAQDTDSDEEDLIESWESEPGIVRAPVRLWNPLDPLSKDSHEEEADIAVAAAAITTEPIKNATFKFAKPVSLDFFEAGIIDLPPGAVKKPKNSRKMHLVFFVFSGRVSVTINDSTFRIGKGGMFQVYRGKLDFIV